MSTLGNFGVPVGNGPQGDGIMQPKLNYRFRVMLTQFGTTADTKSFTRQVMNVTRPTVDFEPVQLDSYNSKSFIAGKHTWGDVNIVLRDDAANNLTKLVGQQLQKQMDFRQQLSPSGEGIAGQNYKFGAKIQTLDGNSATPIEMFLLEGCYLSNVAYGQQDYSSSEPVQISLTLKYDNCIITEQDNIADASIMPNNDFGAATGP